MTNQSEHGLRLFLSLVTMKQSVCKSTTSMNSKPNLMLEINKEEFVFGRASTCDQIINASEISNVHCSIYRVKKENGHDYEYFVEDRRYGFKFVGESGPLIG